MSEIIYNKLVRDKIPTIIKNNNKVPFFQVATKSDVKHLLLNKLIEELEEFKETPNEEELADILEVIDGITHAFQLDIEKVLQAKADKFVERGGFHNRIILEKVVDPSELFEEQS